MTYKLVAKTLFGCCSSVIFLELLIKEDSGVGNLVTLCAFLFISADGLLHDLQLGRKKLQVPVTEWLKMVIIFFVVNVINNASFSFNIAMPLYTIFRSGSLAASLITEKLVLGRCHSKKKSLAVILMTFGIIMFTYASSKQVQEENHILDWIAGIILLSTSLVLSARMGIYQEQIYSKYGRHHKEALFFTHFLPLPGFLFLASDITQHFNIVMDSPAIGPQTFPIPRMVLFLLGNILSQYVCASSIFQLSTTYSSLTITMLLTLRKFFSILISGWFFGNILTAWHWVGTLLVFIATFMFSNDIQINDGLISNKKSQ